MKSLNSRSVLPPDAPLWVKLGCKICIFIRMLYHCYINICLFFVIYVCKIMIQSLESLYY